MGFLNIGGCPCWVAVNKYREYPAAKNVVIAIGIIIEVEIDKILVRRKISLIKLMVGGAAIFAADIMNHQKVIAGKKVIIPFVRNNLRVCVVSYVIFANANRAEEHNP